jgi:alpha-glucosidase (family GH31 glycosyl hydrolase)
MSYTDAPNAQERMGEFLERCEEHDIPCDSFHLSSGYTSIGPGRYVFNWNREKFPDPAPSCRVTSPRRAPRAQHQARAAARPSALH